LKNILKNIKSNSLILGIIGSVIGTLFILSILPIARYFWKLLFSWSGWFARLITDSTIRSVIKHQNHLNFAIFICVSILLMSLLFSIILKGLKSNRKKNDVEKSLKITHTVIFILSIFIFVEISYLYFVDAIGEELNSIQKIRMAIIAPYVIDQKEEELWSKWYSIRSKIDYINLNNELDDIAAKNNTELPKAFQ